jgi:pyruvate/2-oxoglutarate dehydrogenase complex dihydrolipoamide dehydrogenase (E3) component
MSTAETGESRAFLVQPAPSLTTAALQKAASKARAALTLGIIGGGQLAKMTAQAAAQFGCEVVILERQSEFPAADPQASSETWLCTR